MIDLITPYIIDQYQRALPPYQTFLNSQKKFVANRWKRFFDSQGYENPGIRILRYILQFVDYKYLDEQANNYARYSYHVRFIRRDLMNIFDGYRRGKSFKKLFFYPSTFLTHEYLLPVEDLNSIVNLPLHSDRWEDWRTVRPLRFWMTDTDEYSISLINDRIRYFTIPPSYAIELLDIVALIFKYYVWKRKQRWEEPARELALHIPQQLFLHKYVITDLCWDMTNVWLLKCLQKLFEIDDFDELNQMKNQSLMTNTQYGWVSSDSYRGFMYLWQLTQDTKKSIRPEALLSSKILLNGSLNDRIRLTDRCLSLPVFRQYDYLRWLRDKELIHIFLKIYARQPGYVKTRRIFIEFRRGFLRILKQRPWNVIQDPLLQNQVEMEMHDLMNWCDSVSLKN